MQTGLSIEQEKLILNAVIEWDLNKTVKRATEELLELSLSLFNYDRGKAKDTDNILEEMADVHIVLKHLELKFGNYQKQLNEKILKCNS